jgi:hypothetical protein
VGYLLGVFRLQKRGLVPRLTSSVPKNGNLKFGKNALY